MSFQQQYMLAQPIEQLRPQRLDNQIFFGPLNTLTQTDFIRENNIKFFVGVGISTERLALLCHRNRAIRESYDDCIMVNFDPNFNVNIQYKNAESEEITSHFLHHNTNQLQQLISFLVNSNNCQNPDILRSLTPIPELTDISKLLYSNISKYHGTCVFNESHVDQYKQFNDLMTLFKASSPFAKVLVFSNDGNDVNLVTLLISAVFKANPTIKILEGLQYVKSLRSNTSDIKEENIIWCGGLVDYYECIRAKELNWGSVSVPNNRNYHNVQSFRAKKRTEKCLETIEPNFFISPNEILTGSANKRCRSHD